MKVYEEITNQIIDRPVAEVFAFFQSRKSGGDYIFEYRKSLIDDLFSTEEYKLYTSETNHGAIA